MQEVVQAAAAFEFGHWPDETNVFPMPRRADASNDNSALHVVIYVVSQLDCKLLQAACEIGGISHDVVQDPESFRACLRRHPDSVGFIHVGSYPAARTLKADPKLLDRPLFVVNSYGIPHLADLLGGQARRVRELAYPFTIATVLDQLKAYR